MAWRPNENLIRGELDNTVAGKVTGWMCFHGLDEKVTFDLRGDFHRDIKGKKIRLSNESPSNRMAERGNYMNGFAAQQVGDVGDITAGGEPRDYVNYPYIEWYSNENGRVVLELAPSQIEVIGQATKSAA